MQRRTKAAEKIKKALEQLYERSFKLPSFTGKAKFIDSIKRIQTDAHVLADNLRFDQSEER